MCTALDNMEMRVSSEETKLSKEMVAAFINVSPRHHHVDGGWWASVSNTHLWCKDVEVQAVLGSRYVHLLGEDASLSTHGGIACRFSHSRPRIRGLRALQQTKPGTENVKGTRLQTSRQEYTNASQLMISVSLLYTEQISSFVAHFKP